MRAPVLRIHKGEKVIDSFAGGGGASTGIRWALGRDPDLAVNHDFEAIAMYKANHPNTDCRVADVFDVEPLEVCGLKRRWRKGDPYSVGLMWASPDCTFHSKARGKKPHRDRDKAERRRGLANVIVEWAKQVRPRMFAMENVEEWKDWGPLVYDRKRKGWIPNELKKGFCFRRWKKQLENLGYVVEMREMRACDFGAPTNRRRLFIIARHDGRPIVWPEATHGNEVELIPYRTAAECIDWSIESPSIFMTKAEAREWKKRTGRDVRRPLSPKTMRRIAAGVVKHVLKSKKPFLVPLTHGKGGFDGDGSSRTYNIDEPFKTVTGAHRGEVAVVTPFIARIGQQGGNGDYVNDVAKPLTTITTKAEHLVVSPVLIQTSWGEREGQRPRYLDIHEPLGTIMADGIKHSVAEVKLERAELVAAFMAKHYGGEHKSGKPKSGGGSDLRLPVDTITGQDHNYVVSAHLTNLKGSMDDRQSSSSGADEPVPTITAGGNHVAQVCAFMVAYYGTDQDPRLEDPMHTLTTKHRMALVTVVIDGVTYAIVDITMRMLEPRELYNAQGFPLDYIIDPFVETTIKRGKKWVTVRKRLNKTAQVRMCGNSVSPYNAEAILIPNFIEFEREALEGVA